MISLNPHLGLEAVDYQLDASLFNELTAEFKKLREKTNRTIDTEDIDSSKIPEILQKRIGIFFKIEITDETYPSACINIRDLNKNHPFYEKWQALCTSKDGMKLFKDEKSVFAAVDRRSGRIGGAFQRLRPNIYLTTAMVNTKTIISEEIVAVLLHEIGHMFSFLETMWMTTANNLALMSAIEELVGMKDSQVRLKLIKNLKKGRVIEKDFNEQLAQQEADKLVPVVISSAAANLKQRNDCVCYNRTAWEQSADQFATRMGAGKYLATALNKIVPPDTLKRYFWVNSLIHLLLNILGGIVIVSWSSLSPFLGLLAALYISLFTVLPDFYEVAFDDYDKLRDRMRRIKRELIGKLKLFDLKSKYAKAILEEIDAVEEEALKTTNRYSNVFAYPLAALYNLFTGELTKKEREQQIEQLINSDLFVNAYKFANLETK